MSYLPAKTTDFFLVTYAGLLQSFSLMPTPETLCIFYLHHHSIWLHYFSINCSSNFNTSNMIF